jgi:uncharacterized protein YndB with AHSA1/START domain
MLSAKVELRPGGTFLYGMRAPDRSEMWGKFTYREIVAPERLVFIVSFCDDRGNVKRHPMSPTWPLETLSTVTFALHAGGTKVTVQWQPHQATEEERATFEAGLGSMQQGWTGTLDQFASYLAGIEELAR